MTGGPSVARGPRLDTGQQEAQRGQRFGPLVALRTMLVALRTGRERCRAFPAVGRLQLGRLQLGRSQVIVVRCVAVLSVGELPTLAAVEVAGDRASAPRPERVIDTDGLVELYRSFLSCDEADRLFKRLLSELDWTHEHARVYGRRVALPRLTAWYGPVAYAYSGVRHPPRPFAPVLDEVRERIEPLAPGINCVLGNQYRDGSDSVSWHADDDPEAGGEPLVCSVSFGATRRFRFRHRERHLRVELELRHGDVIVMNDVTQGHWQHMVPKAPRATAPRVNLTYRRFLEH